MNGRGARKRSYGIALALVAGAILIVGLLLKPREPAHALSTDARVDGVRADLNTLRELAERNSLRNTSARFSAMAAADAAFLARTDRGDPATRWSRGGWLVPLNTPAPAPLEVEVNGKELPVAPIRWGAGVPFVEYSANTLPPPAPNIAPIEDLEPGTWMLVDTPGKDGPEFISGMFSGTGETTCGGVDYTRLLLNSAFDARLVGAAMFDIDGNLVAVLAQCDGEVAAIPLAEIKAHLAFVDQPAQRPFAHAGFIVKPIRAAQETVLGSSSGLVVTDVWTDFPAGAAGLVPGDVILSINNTPAGSSQQLASALDNLPVRLRIQNATHSAADMILPAATTSASVAFQNQARNLTLSNVSDEMASRFGLRSGDHVLTLDGHPATEKSVTQLLSSPSHSAGLLMVQRGDRQFLVPVQK